MTRWIFHCHVADNASAPEREHRLTWKKVSKKQSRMAQSEDDDQRAVVYNIADYPKKEEGVGSPLQEILGITKSRVQKSMRPEDLLQELESPQGGTTLGTFLTQHRTDILHTISRNISSTQANEAIKLKNMFEEGAKPEKIRLKIEQLLFQAKPKAEQKPETDVRLKAEMDKLGKGTETADKESRWQRFLKEIAKLANPLYSRLASFLQNPAVRALHMIYPEEAFKRLSHPGERFPLLQTLASMRHALVFQGSENLEDRRRALHDLSAIFTHSEHLLSPDERVMLLEPMMRVQACASVLDEYAASIEGEKTKAQTPDRLIYHAKALQVRKFFEEEKSGNPGHALRGKNGILGHLNRSNKHPDDVFGILVGGLQDNGWIAELHVPETLKYTCTLIALEEIGYVYMQIAAGNAEPLTPAALQAKVKKLVLEALQRGVRGPRESDTVPFAVSQLDPRQQFEELRAQIAKKPNPTNAEVNEFLLLFEWLTYRGEAPVGVRRQDIQRLRSKVAVETKELREETDRAREELPLVAESGAVRSFLLDHLVQRGESETIRTALQKHGDCWMRYQAYVTQQANKQSLHPNRLRESAGTMRDFIEETLSEEEQKTIAEAILALKQDDSEFLLAGLRGVQEEQSFYEEAKEALSKLASTVVPEEDRAKLTHRASRDPETLRAALDTAYVIERRSILDGSFGSEKEREKRLVALDRAYEDEKGMRQILHRARVKEWEDILLAALEAEIRLRARELSEEYTAALFQRRKQIKALHWDPFLNELDALRALENLERENLRDDPHPALKVEEDIKQLRALEQIVRNPLAEAKEIEADAEEGKQAAMRLLRCKEFQNAPKEMRARIEQYASGALLAGPGVTKWLQKLAAHPEVAERAAQELEGMERQAETINDVAKKGEELRKKQEKVFDAIQRVLPKYIDEYGVSLQLEQERKLMRSLIAQGEHNMPTARKDLAEAEWWLARLEEFARILHTVDEKGTQLLTGAQFAALAKEQGIPENSSGAFVYGPEGQERIVLNASEVQNPTKRALVETEERMHVLHHALHQLYPLYFQQIYQTLTSKNTPANIRDTFDALAREWVPKGTMTEEQWQVEVADEFMAKRTVYRQYRAQYPRALESQIPLTSKESAFFKEIAERHIQIMPLEERPRLRKRGRSAAAARGGQLDVGADQGPTGMHELGRGNIESGEAEMEGSEDSSHQNEHAEASPGENIEEARKILIKAKGFLEANPDHGADSADNRAYVAELEQEYEQVQKDYSATQEAEKDENLNQRAASLKKRLEDVETQINKFDFEQEDLRKVPPEGRGFQGVWKNIEWLSIADVIRIFKDIGEDIKRQYNRRQEGKIGRVGEMITAWISPKMPYIGNLHHDFHERKQKAEIDEVEHFKKGLANVDSFEIQFMTHHTTNRDVLKACIIELTDRGRMNWNDTEMWATFNKLSRFKMPTKECQRNENLKEAWLRKIISDIWEDKDNYRTWNRKNDEQFTAKMKEYEPEADRLSNLSGGLSGELEKQLRTFVELREDAHRTGKHVPLDEAVRMDLYMEVIDYAIVKGKMSMEAKFFYLIQGIAEGLIPASRLRILAGQHLNIFPFIDYFYGRNNTLPEIQALAKRLLETDETALTNPDRFKPGPKTTLWLELEVAREKRVQERLSKGMSKRGAEIDHDDMHFFAPRVDHYTIAGLTTPQGGGRPQVSPEGWENAYSGFNSYFKSFGMLAKLEKENVGERFTSKDAQEVIRSVATFVRMDGILTKRDTFGDTEGRRTGLAWNRMRRDSSVVNIDGKTVYEERKTVDHFVKDLLRAYGYGAQEVENMLYSTEVYDINHPEKSKIAKKESDRLDTRLRKAVERDGTTKMQEILINYMPQFNTHQKGYNYENVKKIKEEERHKKIAPATSSVAHAA